MVEKDSPQMLPTRLQTSRLSLTKLTGIIMESLDPSMLVSESDQSILLQMSSCLLQTSSIWCSFNMLVSDFGNLLKVSSSTDEPIQRRLAGHFRRTSLLGVLYRLQLVNGPLPTWDTIQRLECNSPRRRVSLSWHGWKMVRC